MRGILLLLGWAILVTACASVPPVQQRYDVEENVTVYETKEIDIPGLGQSSEMAPSSQAYMVAQGFCMGKNCSPGKYAIQFVLGGRTSSESYATDVVFETDSGRLSWGSQAGLSPSQLDRLFVNPADNTVAEISLTPTQMRKIARSSSVDGRVGPYDFSLRGQALTPLRKLLQAPQETAPSASSSDSTAT